MNVGDLVAHLKLDSKQFNAGIQAVSGKLKTFTSLINPTVLGLTKFAAKVIGAGLALNKLAISLARPIAEMETLHRRITVMTGTSEGNARAWDLLEETSGRLGKNIGTLADSYGKLMASTRGTSMSLEDVEQVFLAVSEASSAMGLSSQQTSLAFLAIEQMASKGVVSMEELRRQLSEHIPGAMGIMARALGISIQELNKWVASGELLAEDVLPLFANQLRKENIPALKEMDKAIQKSVGRSETAWFKLKKTVSEGWVKDMVTFLLDSTRLLVDFVGAVANIFNKSFQWIKEIGPETQGLVAGLAQYSKETKDIVLKTEEEISEAQERIQAKMRKTPDELKAQSKAMDAWAKEMAQGIVKPLEEITSLFSDIATGVDISFKDTLNKMAKSLLDFTTQILIIRPVMVWLENWFKGLGGTGGLGGALLGKLGMPSIQAMAGGGVITEPVLGMGLKSGSGYLMGEKGPETVTPAGQGNNQPINVTINALDSKSVTDLMNSNPQAVLQPLVNAINSGDRGLSMSLRTAVN